MPGDSLTPVNMSVILKQVSGYSVNVGLSLWDLWGGLVGSTDCPLIEETFSDQMVSP